MKYPIMRPDMYKAVLRDDGVVRIYNFWNRRDSLIQFLMSNIKVKKPK